MNQRTADIYNFIAEFIEREGYSPSLREIAAGTGIPAISNVSQHLSALEGQGLITRRPGCVRTIRLCKAPRSVAEGHGTPVQEAS